MNLNKLCSKFEVDISKKILRILFCAQYHVCPLDEMYFPFVSNLVIFDQEEYKSDFFQDHFTF